MKSLYQGLLIAKIEYHWWRIKALRKKKNKGSDKGTEKYLGAESLHRYKADKASLEYEISVGLRNQRGEWKKAA